MGKVRAGGKYHIFFFIFSISILFLPQTIFVTRGNFLMTSWCLCSPTQGTCWLFTGYRRKPDFLCLESQPFCILALSHPEPYLLVCAPCKTHSSLEGLSCHLLLLLELKSSCFFYTNAHLPPNMGKVLPILKSSTHTLSLLRSLPKFSTMELTSCFPCTA